MVEEKINFPFAAALQVRKQQRGLSGKVSGSFCSGKTERVIKLYENTKHLERSDFPKNFSTSFSHFRSLF